jgi:hypothetical protein
MASSFSNPFFKSPAKLKEYSEDEKQKIVSLIDKNDFNGLESVLKDGYNINFVYLNNKYSGIQQFISYMTPNITIDMINFLKEKGADFSLSLGNLMNAIVYYAAFGRTDIVKYLWENKLSGMNEDLISSARKAAHHGENFFARNSITLTIAHPETKKYIQNFINKEYNIPIYNPLSSIKTNSSTQRVNKNSRNSGVASFNPLRMLSTAKGGKRFKKSKKMHKKTLKKKRSSHKKY